MRKQPRSPDTFPRSFCPTIIDVIPSRRAPSARSGFV
jgi:hypothetical protein